MSSARSLGSLAEKLGLAFSAAFLAVWPVAAVLVLVESI